MQDNGPRTIFLPSTTIEILRLNFVDWVGTTSCTLLFSRARGLYMCCVGVWQRQSNGVASKPMN